tara:strand:- start:4638 stop:4919 length:282 start_codon:yes stop_codon:yes gene_type:complete
MTKFYQKNINNSQELESVSAIQVINYLNDKFDASNDDFWIWLFTDCKFGETSILLLSDMSVFNKQYREYILLIKEEYIDYVDDDFSLEIENDL